MFWLTILLASQFVSPTAIEYRQPQLAAADGMVAMTFGSDREIYFTASRDAGATWSDRVAVARPVGMALGNHRGPRIVVTRGVLVISAIAGPRGKGLDGDLVTWRSVDQGKSWTAGAPVTDQPGAAREGLHAMAAAPDGRLFATWLDLRSVKPGQPGTELWGAYSSDAGLTWSKNLLVYRSPDGTICQCCHPSAMFDGKGDLQVMWRNALGGNRDMYLIRSKDGGRTFGAAEKLGNQSWKLEACPMNGGGLARNTRGETVAVWRREKTIYETTVAGSETVLGTGKNPAVAYGKSGVYTAWNTPEGLFVKIPGQAVPVPLDPEGSFASLTALPEGPVVAAWERKGTIQFRTLP